MCNRMIMADIYFFLLTNAQSTEPFLFLHFCIILPHILHYQGLAFELPALLIPSFTIRTTCYQVVLFFPGPPSGPILPPYLLLLPKPPIFVVIKYLNSGLTACLFASKLASYLFSGCHCHTIPCFESSLLRTLLFFLHFLYSA